MSNSHRFYGTSRVGKGGIEYPIDMNPNHENSDYWIKRLYNAMTIILANPKMESVWDSELVPDKASYMVHALLAEKIACGKIGMELKWGSQIVFDIFAMAEHARQYSAELKQHIDARSQEAQQRARRHFGH